MNCFFGLLFFLFPILTSASFRIVGGALINITDAPYQIYLYNQAVNRFCGGAIIGKRVLLTAGHCVKNITSVSQLDIRVGSNNHQKKNTPVCKPIKVIPHPNFDAKELTNDIAIILLKEELNYTNSVQAVNLPEAEDDVKEGTVGIVTGWGYTAPPTNGSASPLLKYAKIKVQPKKTCEDTIKKYDSRIFIHDSIFCAATDDYESSSCNGDSGSPFVSDGNVVQGLVSWGWQCGKLKRPVIYTKVVYYLDFINANSK